MAMSHSLRDRISKRLQARSLTSSRYGDFTFDSSPRRRRRNGRFSSVCVSSAEPTPLFHAPAPSQGQVLVDTKSQPTPGRSTIDPLATASLMLATVELDRLTNRQVSNQSSEVLGSGQSSVCGGPPSSPALNSLVSAVKPSMKLDTTSCVSGRFTIPRKPISVGMNMRSGNCISQAAAHSDRMQRKTSSRFSDTRTTENILEASDEDVSPATCTPGESCTPTNLDPGSQALCPSMASPTEIAESVFTGVWEPGLAAVPVDQGLEQTRSTHPNDAPKGFWASTGTQNERIPEVPDRIFLNDSGQTQTRKIPAHHLYTGALTPQNTRGLWCPARKSPSPPRRQSVWNAETPTDHFNE